MLITCSIESTLTTKQLFTNKQPKFNNNNNINHSIYIWENMEKEGTKERKRVGKIIVNEEMIYTW